MFCNQCGANLPEGTAFCSKCGSAQNVVPQTIPVEDDWDKTQRVRSAPKQNLNPAPQPAAPAWEPAPQPAAPVWEPAPQPAPEPVWEPAPQPAPQPAWNPQPQPVNYDWNPPQYQPAAPKKKSSLPILITGLLSVVLIIFSAVAPLATNLLEIPVMSSLPEEEMAELENSLEELKTDWEDNQGSIELAKEEMTAAQIKSFENMVEKVEDLLDDPTILKLNVAADALIAMEEDFDEDEEFLEDLSSIKELKENLIPILMGVCLGAFALPFLFALLGALLKNTALTVIAMVLTLPVQWALSGVLYIVLSGIVYIVQIVLCSKYKK